MRISPTLSLVCLIKLNSLAWHSGLLTSLTSPFCHLSRLWKRSQGDSKYQEQCDSCLHGAYGALYCDCVLVQTFPVESGFLWEEQRIGIYLLMGHMCALRSVLWDCMLTLLSFWAVPLWGSRLLWKMLACRSCHSSTCGPCGLIL